MYFSTAVQYQSPWRMPNSCNIWDDKCTMPGDIVWTSFSAKNYSFEMYSCTVSRMVSPLSSLPWILLQYQFNDIVFGLILWRFTTATRKLHHGQITWCNILDTLTNALRQFSWQRLCPSVPDGSFNVTEINNITAWGRQICIPKFDWVLSKSFVHVTFIPLN